MSKLIVLTALALISAASISRAETYVINGTKDQPKLKAIVALANDPKAKVERCQYKEKQDSNEGAVVCRVVELGPRGNLRLAK